MKCLQWTGARLGSPSAPPRPEESKERAEERKTSENNLLRPAALFSLLQLSILSTHSPNPGCWFRVSSQSSSSCLLAVSRLTNGSAAASQKQFLMAPAEQAFALDPTTHVTWLNLGLHGDCLSAGVNWPLHPFVFILYREK